MDGSWGESLLKRVTPEQSLGHDLELQRRGKERSKGVGKGQRDLPFRCVEMRNSILHSRNAGRGRGITGVGLVRRARLAGSHAGLESHGKDFNLSYS